MSKLCTVDWPCAVCDCANTFHPNKPNAFQSTCSYHTCEGCGSKFLLLFEKVKGKELVTSKIIKYVLSEEGAKLYKEKLEKEKAGNSAGNQ